MAGNTGSTIQENQTFTTSAVPIVVGVLNPVNSPQSVWDCGVGMLYAMMTTSVTGSPVSFTILLEGTYDGTNWVTIATTTNVAGETQFGTTLAPFTNLRARCTAVSGGTSPTVNVFATASQTPFVNVSGSTAPATSMQILGTTGSTANVDANNALLVSNGAVGSTTTLNAVSATTTGTVQDNKSGKASVAFQVVTSGTITAGAITFLGSVDGVTFVPLTVAAVLGSTGSPTITAGVLSMTAGTTALVGLGNVLTALRYFRADVTTTVTGGGTVTVKVAAW
jgi:hypothetical protein